MYLQDTSLEVELLGQKIMCICNFGSYRHIPLHREEEHIFIFVHQSVYVSMNKNIGFSMVRYGKGVHGQVLGFSILIKW